MKRTIVALLIGACLTVMPGTAAVAGETNPLLQAVPADAWVVVAIPSLSEFDKRLTNYSQAVNSPTAGMSMLMMAKGALGMFTGVDDNGGFAVVLMPLDSVDNVDDNIAMLIPTTDLTALLSTMQPEDAGDGISKISMQGEESYAAAKGKFAVLSPNIDVVKAILASKAGADSAMSPFLKERFGKDDLVIWANAKQVSSSTLFEQTFMPMLLSAGEAQNSAKSIERSVAMLRSFKNVQVSLRLDPQGLVFASYVDADAGSEADKAIRSLKASPGSALLGLPGESYVAAVGTLVSSDLAKMCADAIEDAVPTLASCADESMAETVTKLASIVKNMALNMRSVGVGVNALPESEDGLVALTLVMGLEGNAKSLLDSASELYNTIMISMPEEEAAGMKEAIAYKIGTEGENVHQLTLNPAALGAGEDEVNAMVKVLGKEGVSIRFAAVGSKHVAITLGGGKVHLGNVTKLIQTGGAPLKDEAGIKKVAAGYPGNRFTEGYLSASAASQLASTIGKAVDEEVPFALPPIETPIAFYGVVTEGGGEHVELLIPMDLIKAGVQMFTQQMGGGGGGPPM